VATAKAAQALSQEGLIGSTPARIHPELATGDELAGLLPQGAVHQGLALHVAPLPDLGIEDVVTPLSESQGPALLFLDQVSDPHNVGAIIRSAAAFGATAVIVQDRHAPQITGTLAKSASGAVEHVPIIRVTNLARALEAVADVGYFRVGLAGEAEEDLGKTTLTGKIALVLGAEGPGLRRLTREKCDLLVKLPTHEPISSLNVSNAAAVALFAIATLQS
jgi:23S rRNA (guanosine2251-2'-O)-methyltransferase